MVLDFVGASSSRHGKSSIGSDSPSLLSSCRISNHMSWIVTMWHFGQDSLTGYSGEKFEVPWKDGLELFHVYPKKSNTMRIRKERQEYPNKPLGEAFMDKVEAVNGGGGGSPS